MGWVNSLSLMSSSSDTNLFATGNANDVAAIDEIRIAEHERNSRAESGILVR